MSAIKDRELMQEWSTARDEDHNYAFYADKLMGALIEKAKLFGFTPAGDDRAAQLEMEIYRYLRDSNKGPK
jgi:hypothetical protein